MDLSAAGDVVLDLTQYVLAVVRPRVDVGEGRCLVVVLEVLFARTLVLRQQNEFIRLIDFSSSSS